MVCLHETVRPLVDTAKPTAHCANVGWSGEVLDGSYILVGRLDPLHGDLESGKLD